MHDYSLGNPFIELQSVDSTNNYALGRIHAKLAQPGTCYFAHHQTKGKGQYGKTWISEKSSNIVLSIVIIPEFLNVLQQFYLSACTATAVHDFFSNYAGSETKIKWPNDIYWQDKKAGGILIDNIIINQSWSWSVIGVGININQTEFPNDLKNPVSLKEITGKKFEVIKLAKELCGSLDHFYKLLKEEGFKTIFETYRQCLYKKGEKVRLRKRNQVLQAIIKDVTESGQIVIEHAFEELVNPGEIEWA